MILQTTKLPTTTKIMYCNSTKGLIVISPYKCVGLLFILVQLLIWTCTVEVYLYGLLVIKLTFLTLKFVNLLEVINGLFYIRLLKIVTKHSLLPD